MKLLLLVIVLLGSAGCDELPAFANGCTVRIYKDHSAGVVNPEQCPDRQLVQYLNCSNLVVPLNQRPKECQQ